MSFAFLLLILIPGPAACWDFIRRPQNQTVNLGAVATIECEAPASVHPIYQFRRGNGQAFSNRIVARHGDLTITDVKLEDEGWYLCIVSADGGVVKSASSYLSVAPPPKFVLTPHNITVNLGRTATLSCSATPSTGATYEWLKGDTLLIPGRDTSVNKDTGLLTKYNVNLDDVAIYTCRATTTRGVISASAAILIPNLSAPTTPTIESFGVDPVSVRCTTSGAPSPVFAWTHNNNNLDTVLVKSLVSSEISEVTAEESGVYTCKASNIMGVTGASITISIKENPTPAEPTSKPAITPVITGIIIAAVILVVTITIGGIVCCCTGRRKTYHSRPSYRRRRKRLRREDYDDNMWTALGMRPSWDSDRHMMGFGMDRPFSSSSNMPLSEYDYASRPVSFNFAKRGSMSLGGKSSFSPSNPMGGNRHTINPGYGDLDDIESTLQRQVRELDSIPSASAASTPASIGGGRGKRPKEAEREVERYSTLTRMMSGDPFEEPEEWGPEHEDVVSLQNNIRMSRVFEVTSLRRSFVSDRQRRRETISEEDSDDYDYDDEDDDI